MQLSRVQVEQPVCLAACTVPWIFMKFDVVVNHYLGTLSFKFHEDLCTNACAKVVNARTRDKTCACAFTTHVGSFLHGSS